MTLSILRLLMPFIWEWMLGKQGLKEALRSNKRRVLVFLLVMASLGLNGFLTKRVVTLAAQNLELRNQLSGQEVRKKQTEEPYDGPPNKNPPVNGKLDQDAVLLELESFDSKLKGGPK